MIIDAYGAHLKGKVVRDFRPMNDRDGWVINFTDDSALLIYHDTFEDTDGESYYERTVTRAEYEAII